MKKPSKPLKPKSTVSPIPETSGKPQPSTSKASSKPQVGARTQKAKKLSRPLMPSCAQRRNIEQWCEAAAPEEPILFADGHDHAFVGVAFINHTAIAVYDQERTIQGIKEGAGVDLEDAEEFFDFNIAGAHVGERTPAFLLHYSDQLNWLHLDLLISFLAHNQKQFIGFISDSGAEKTTAKQLAGEIIDILVDQAIKTL